MDEEVSCAQLTACILHACKALKSAELFDVYRDDRLGKGKKSMAFSLFFTAGDKPLEAADVDRFVKKILGNLKFRLGAELR